MGSILSPTLMGGKPIPEHKTKPVYKLDWEQNNFPPVLKQRKK